MSLYIDILLVTSFFWHIQLMFYYLLPIWKKYPVTELEAKQSVHLLNKNG